MKTLTTLLLSGCTALLLFAGQAAAHCEIPCGVYDDAMRIRMILEHITTIEKSMNQILFHEKEQPHNPNQLVRWIVNKEQHADELQEIVSQYFMTQRLKPDMKNYQAMLGHLHEMLIYAMQSKQTTDPANPARLRELTAAFEALYFAKDN